MFDAGVDTSIFKPHSTRSAATSAAKLASVPLDEIMATVGWRSNSVFAGYYPEANIFSWHLCLCCIGPCLRVLDY